MQSKLKKIKLLVLDCDGVLTPGFFYYGFQEEIKQFNTKDGLGLVMFLQFGYKVAVITGRESGALAQRCSDLKIEYLFQGVRNKLAVLTKLKDKLKISLEEICYVGDDLNDFECLQSVGFGVCPANANFFLKDKVDYVCQTDGGKGCVREVIDYILEAKNELKDAQENFIKNLSAVSD